MITDCVLSHRLGVSMGSLLWHQRCDFETHAKGVFLLLHSSLTLLFKTWVERESRDRSRLCESTYHFVKWHCRVGEIGDDESQIMTTSDGGQEAQTGQQTALVVVDRSRDLSPARVDVAAELSNK